MTSHAVSASLGVSIVVASRFHAFELARELAQKGHLHRLVSMYPRHVLRRHGVPPERGIALLSTLVAEQTLRRFGSGLSVNVAARVNAQFAARAARKLAGTRIVHGWSGYSLESLRWARAHGVGCVVERSSSHILTQTEILERECDLLGVPFSRPDQRWLDREMEEYELADRIAVPSLFALRSFVAHGFPESKLLYAPFGVNLESFSPGPKPDSVFRVVYAGALSLQKGVHYLIDAFGLADLPHSELLLIGSPVPETPLLLAKADSRMRQLQHLPHSELVQQYRSGSVFVMPSIQEGMAVVQAQALASGLPLVCTQNTGGEDLLRLSGECIAHHVGGIQEYAAGYVVPPRDAQAIARCLNWVAQDDAKLAEKRKEALATRSRALAWSDYAERVIAGYRQISES